MNGMIIGIIGSSNANPKENLLAQEVGELLAKEGIIIICGGLGGVMEACCRGVKENGGLTIAILPGVSATDANPYVDIPIPTGIGEARNLIIIRASSSIIAIGGGYGTLSEIAFALRLGIPVIGLETWELEKISKESLNIIKVKTAKEAVKKAIEMAQIGGGASFYIRRKI